jgi:hypothetical protein
MQIYVYLVPHIKNITVGVVSSHVHVHNGPSKGYICFFVFHSVYWSKPSSIWEHCSSGIRHMSNPQLHCRKNLRTHNGLSVFFLPPWTWVALQQGHINNAQSSSVYIQNLPVHHDYFLTMSQQMEGCPPSTKEVSISMDMPCHKPKNGNLKLVLKCTRSLQASLQCLQFVCVAQ